MDEELSTYKLEHPPEDKNNSKWKTVLEKHTTLHTALLVLVLLGTCMVIGDGLLTPAISGRKKGSYLHNLRLPGFVNVSKPNHNVSGCSLLGRLRPGVVHCKG